MAATIQQIAELAGVSRGTVDRVLNGRGRVKAEVKEKVEQIARDLDYTPKHRKKEATPRHRRLGVVTQLSQASFMIQINRGIADACEQLRRRDFEIILKESPTVSETEQLQALDELERAGIDGLAIMPVDSDNVRYRLNWLTREQGIPMITFNTDITGVEHICFVGLDNRKSGRTAAGLMGMMTGGVGKVLGIIGYFSNNAVSRRIDGFIEGIKDNFPNLELVGVQSSFDQEDEVERIIVNTLTAYPDLKGIFLTSGGQSGLRSAFEKLKLPKRPYVIICDLTPKNTALIQDGIADFVIDQDGYQQGYQALSLLADQLQWGTEPTKKYMYTETIIKTKYNI